MVRCEKGVQAKRLRVAQIVLLGGDGQLLHILDGLKVLWRKLETAKHLLIVGMRPEAEGNLVPEPLILNRLNLLVTPIEEIGMGQRWCFSHATGSFALHVSFAHITPITNKKRSAIAALRFLLYRAWQLC